ncbi:hypothetical protein N7493_003619 [Penicillium malachiteum]|uniref:AB hydrolase-1 domain-containing protein n=1 Tax=Penicillium malachiteum TaxID=1324776 RepID=A0AAD6MXS8_9EURO|nr:hypothetical protein N7493_003619 [Penicillium malachiteum]
MATSTPPKPTGAQLEPPPELFYQVHNPTGKETILLIHGACGSSIGWREVIPALIEKDYHILAPDLPSHGNSLSIQPFTVEYSAKLIINLIIKYAKNSRAHVVGLSLGAHITACIAEQAAPGTIQSIIAAGYNNIPRSRYLIPLIAPTSYVLHHLVSFAQGPSKEVAQVLNGEASYGLIAEVARVIFQPRALGEIPVKSLVICAGSKDNWITRDNSESSKKLFEMVVGGKEGGSRVVVHDGIKHAWHVLSPELFSQTVLNWVRGEPLDSGFQDIE